MFGRAKSRAALIAFAVAALMIGTACGNGEDRPGRVTREKGTGTGSGSVSGSVSASGPGGGASKADDGYKPVSDVDQHAAIGDDAAAIKKHLAAAKKDQPVDWAAVERVWEQGGALKKADGSNRTLKTLVAAPDVVAFVEGAIEGGPSDAVRAQQVEKGITVLLARKVVEELEAAAEKVAVGQTAPTDGAPHNVDEAWAFFTAKGNGPAATAEKRAADFKREGKVREPIVEALSEAQRAAAAGDAAALDTATEEAQDGLDYIFYLATYKYLGADNAVGRAEGRAFYLGIQPQVQGADREADQVIVDAFQSGDEAAGRAALHRPPVLVALGIDGSERVDS